MPSNTTASEDRIVDKCREFGGVAEECADVVDSLDSQLSTALSKIETLEQEIQELQNQ